MEIQYRKILRNGIAVAAILAAQGGVGELRASVPSCSESILGQPCLGPLGISGGIDNTVSSILILVNQPAVVTVGSSGSNPPFRYNIVAGAIPGGFTTSTTPAGNPRLTEFILSGTPATAGTFTFDVQVTDALGDSYTAALSIQAYAAPPVGSSSGPPVITSLSPSVATVGESSFQLTVNGGNFAEDSVVNWNGTPLPCPPTIHGTTNCYANSGELVAMVGSSLLNSPGTVSISVSNSLFGGGVAVSAPLPLQIFAFSVNASFYLSNYYSFSITAGSNPFTLTVNGSTVTPFAPSAVIQWNGVNLITQFVSATQLMAVVSAAQVANAGVAAITVFSDNQLLGPVPFTVYAPPYTLSPSSIVAGSGSFVLTAAGFTVQPLQPSYWVWDSLIDSVYSPYPTYFSEQLALGGTPTTGIVSAYDVSYPGIAFLPSSYYSIIPCFTIYPFSLTPSQQAAGGPGFTLTLTSNPNGNDDLANYEVIFFNGVAVPITPGLNNTTLASIGADLIASPGTVWVTYGGSNVPVPFTIVQEVTLPNLVGINEATAANIIANEGLVVGTVTNSTSTTVPFGDVISESPVPGNAIPIGTSVSLVISAGAPLAVCEVRQNGNVSVSDVQFITDEALGQMRAVNDLNGDGVVNVIDVQIVLNAALGLGCLVV